MLLLILNLLRTCDIMAGTITPGTLQCLNTNAVFFNLRINEHLVLHSTNIEFHLHIRVPTIRKMQSTIPIQKYTTGTYSYTIITAEI